MAIYMRMARYSINMIAPLICEKFLVRDQTTKLPLFCQEKFYEN
jgi:hypothetical protein